MHLLDLPSTFPRRRKMVALSLLTGFGIGNLTRLENPTDLAQQYGPFHSETILCNPDSDDADSFRESGRRASTGRFHAATLPSAVTSVRLHRRGCGEESTKVASPDGQIAWKN